MATQESIETARSIAKVIPQSQSTADKSPMMVVQYVPALGTGGSSASIALVQNSSMTFLVDSAAPTGADAIGASGVILTSSSTYDTMGELVDYINSRQAWRAYLVAALRSDASSILLAKSATLCSGATGLTFYGDTSQNEGSIVPGTAAAYEIVGTAISGEQFVSNGINGHYKDQDDQIENSLIYAEIQLTFTGTGTLRIFSGKQGSAEVLIYNQTLTSTTEQDFGRTGTTVADGLNTVFLTAPRGERLIVRAGTTTAFSAYTKFNVLGRSAVLSGDHLVETANFTA